jgi:hypothetical protein
MVAGNDDSTPYVLGDEVRGFGLEFNGSLTLRPSRRCRERSFTAL